MAEKDTKATAPAKEATEAKATKVVHFKCEKYPDIKIWGGESIISFEGGRFQSKDADTIERIRNCATYQEGTIVEYDPKKEVAAEDDAE